MEADIASSPADVRRRRLGLAATVRVARAIATALFGLAALCVVIVIVGIWASVRQAPPWVGLRTLIFFSVYFAALPFALAVIFCAIGWHVRAKATGRN